MAYAGERWLSVGLWLDQRQVGSGLGAYNGRTFSPPDLGMKRRAISSRPALRSLWSDFWLGEPSRFGSRDEIPVVTLAVTSAATLALVQDADGRVRASVGWA